MGLIGPRTLIATALVFAAVVVHRQFNPKPREAQLGPGGLRPPPIIEPEGLLCRRTILIYFTIVTWIMATFSPENQISTGCHQRWGPCNAMEPDMLNFPRTRYNCDEQYPKWYFRVEDCPKGSKEATGRWARVTPTQALKNDKLSERIVRKVGNKNITDNVATWYTVCGQPHAPGAWPVWQFAVTSICAVGCLMYQYCLAAKDEDAEPSYFWWYFRASICWGGIGTRDPRYATMRWRKPSVRPVR